MTANQIRCFEAVCQTMNFSKAANMLYISQPAISKSVSKLEEELGVELFRQMNNAVYLTAAGELFRDFTGRVRGEYDDLRARLDQQKSLQGRTVRLGCPETWNPAYFAGKLEECFYAANPDGRLVIEVHKLSDLLMLLQNGTLDIIVSHDFYSPTVPSLSSISLTETGIGILYAEDRFGGPDAFRQMTEAGFLLYDQDIEKRFGAVIQDICARRGLTTRITNRGQITKALFDVARGEGVMLFTDWDSAAGNKTYGYYPLSDTLPVKLLYISDRISPYMTGFIESASKIVWDRQR